MQMKSVPFCGCGTSPWLWPLRSYTRKNMKVMELDNFWEFLTSHPFSKSLPLVSWMKLVEFACLSHDQIETKLTIHTNTYTVVLHKVIRLYVILEKVSRSFNCETAFLVHKTLHYPMAPVVSILHNNALASWVLLHKVLSKTVDF